MIRSLSVLLLFFLLGCGKNTTFNPPNDISEETPREMAGINTNTPLETIIGYLSNMAMQHPSISKQQDYLDLYDIEGNWKNQIIIIFDKNVVTPKNRIRPIIIKGFVGQINRGGPSGTKSEYANDVIFVKSWKHLNLKDVPRKSTGN